MVWLKNSHAVAQLGKHEHVEKVLKVYANTEGSGETAKMCFLTRTLALWTLTIQAWFSERMRIWGIRIEIYIKHPFCVMRLISPFICIKSIGENLNKISNSVLKIWKENYFKLSSAKMKIWKCKGESIQICYDWIGILCTKIGSIIDVWEFQLQIGMICEN